MRKGVILITVVAASRLARVALGLGGGSGLFDVAFSAPDAPNVPSNWPTVGGSGGAGSGPPSDRSPGDDGEPGDDSPPDGHDTWTDFFDWASWTSAKNALPGGLGLPIDVLELGPALGDTLGEVQENHQRKRDLLNTDFKGDSHLGSDGND